MLVLEAQDALKVRVSFVTLGNSRASVGSNATFYSPVNYHRFVRAVYFLKFRFAKQNVHEPPDVKLPPRNRKRRYFFRWTSMRRYIFAKKLPLSHFHFSLTLSFSL